MKNLIVILNSIFLIIGVVECNWDWVQSQIPGNADIKCVYKAASKDPSQIQMEHLYKLALKESRTVQVIEGGEEKLQFDWTRIAFEKKFPCLKANLSVNLTKYQKARIIKELQERKPWEKLSFDIVTQLPIPEFHTWRDDGVLLKYKPPGFRQIPNDIKDPDGYFMAIKMVTFGNYAKKSVANQPNHYSDYLKSEWKGGGKLVLVYPHDDDPVLYQFYQALKVNPDFVKEIVKQNPRWVRGTLTPFNLINQNVDNSTASFTTAGYFDNDKQSGEFTLSLPPEIFITWGQTSAIFKDGRNVNTAKLWLTWWLSREQQEAYAGFQWAARKDIKSPVLGMKHWTEYNNTSPKDFIDFLRNRPLLDRLSKMMSKIIGPVLGPSPVDDDL